MSATPDYYVFNYTYYPQSYGKVKKYNQTLTAMLCCYMDNHQGDWAPYASTLTYAYNSHAHRPTSTCPFGLVLNHRIPEFTLQSTVSTAKHLPLPNSRLDS